MKWHINRNSSYDNYATETLLGAHSQNTPFKIDFKKSLETNIDEKNAL